jgi:thymidylate synthase (FAD)
LITEPTVTVWGHTVITDELIDFIGFSEEDNNGIGPTDMDFLGTAAGKICYAMSPTWRNPSTNTVEKYIKNILDLRHYSVLAHASVTVYITGVSRSLTLELIRHRFLGFSQLSQRYADSSEMDWVCPPLAIDDGIAQQVLASNFTRAISDYEFLAGHFEAVMPDANAHMRRKRAREAARAVLPNDTETRLVVSGNIRAWRDFLVQRLDPTADLEIMRLGSVMLEVIRNFAPVSVSDLGMEEL